MTISDIRLMSKIGLLLFYGICFIAAVGMCTYRLILHYFSYVEATRWCIWLRHCAISQKVAGLIPDGVIGIFDITLLATIWP